MIILKLKQVNQPNRRWRFFVEKLTERQDYFTATGDLSFTKTSPQTSNLQNKKQ